jgi:hypothetical protein
MVASARSAAWSLMRMFDTWLRTVLGTGDQMLGGFGVVGPSDQTQDFSRSPLELWKCRLCTDWRHGIENSIFRTATEGLKIG